MAEIMEGKFRCPEFGLTDFECGVELRAEIVPAIYENENGDVKVIFSVVVDNRRLNAYVSSDDALMLASFLRRGLQPGVEETGNREEE